MRLALKLLSLIAVIALINSSRDRNNQKYKVVCYWGSWSFYRPGIGKFAAEDINPNICTHIVYGFTKLNPDNTIAVFDKDLDTGSTDWESGEQWGEGMYSRFNNLRSYNPHLTTLVSIGGWNEGSDKYSKMVSNFTSRKTFVNSVVEFLKKYDFDGLDFDWEYPAMKAVADADRTPGNAADKEHFVELLSELHTAFQPNGYILTAAVSAGKPTIDKAYNVPEVNKYLDIINVMTYDFHGGWDQKTGHDAPLHSKSNDTEQDIEFTVEYAINYWLKLGADPKKITMGLPLYGRSFTLKGTDSGLHADTVGAGGKAGKFTEEIGTLGYNEVCEDLKQGGWKVVQDTEAKVPYAVKGNQWVSYDDVESIKAKIEFLKSKGLGGGMVWSIDTDDFKGTCGQGKYPLLKTISGELNGITGPDPVITIPHVTGTTGAHVKTTKAHNGTTASQKVTTASQKVTTASHKATTASKDNSTEGPTQAPDTTADFVCKTAGYFKDNKDPAKYHECADMGDGKLTDIVNHCQAGTVFDDVNDVCKLP